MSPKTRGNSGIGGVGPGKPLRPVRPGGEGTENGKNGGRVRGGGKIQDECVRRKKEEWRWKKVKEV